MYKFNFEVLRKHLKDCKLILWFLKCDLGLTKKTPTFNRFYKKIYLPRKKDSWVLDIKGLLYDNSATEQEKCIYLMLASKRNMTDYFMHDRSTLPLHIAELYFDKEQLETINILEINNREIRFKY